MPKDSPLKSDLDKYIARIWGDGSYRKILTAHLGEETAALILGPKPE